MRVTNFEGANDIIGRPSTTTEDYCDDAFVHRGVDGTGWPVVTMCVQMSPEELAEVNRNGGKIYIQQFNREINMMAASSFNPVEMNWVRDSPTHKPLQAHLLPKK